MKIKVKTYENDNLKVFWKPQLCEHSAICIHGAPATFEVGRTPWIDLEDADTKNIVNIIEQCPSKALSYKIK